MKIVYDAHIFRWQKAGGIRRYFSEVISRLPAAWSPLLLGLDRTSGDLPAHPRLQVSNFSPIRPRRFSQPLKKAYWDYRLLRKADVVHPTYFNLSGGLDYSSLKSSLVVTVHDFAHATYPHLMDDSKDVLRDQAAAIARADHIICISHATRRDLLEHHPDAAGRSSVIHHGSSFEICHDVQDAAIFEHPTFLFVGWRGAYKNFDFLLRSFARACQMEKKLRLLVAGCPFTAEERWQIHLLGLEDRIELSVFPDEPTLRQLYRRAVALVYPSLHEGFGLPPLEAMACGTLAVTSNTTSLPEVVGDAGIMLDPSEGDAWTETMIQIARRASWRHEKVVKGRERAKLFSWANCAAAHTELYRSLK